MEISYGIMCRRKRQKKPPFNLPPFLWRAPAVLRPSVQRHAPTYTEAFNRCTRGPYGTKNYSIQMTDRSNGYKRVAAEFLAGRGSARTRSKGIGVKAVREWARALPSGAAVIDLGCG